MRKMSRFGVALATLALALWAVGSVWAQEGGQGQPAGGKPAQPTQPTQPTGQPQKPADTGKPTVEIGKPAPNFTLTDTEGKQHKLADLKGKIVVLEWTDHQCPIVGLHNKSQTMQKCSAQWKGKPVVWLAIDSNSTCMEKKSDIVAWAKENKIECPILLDAEGTVGKSFGAKTTPHMFVIDKNGNLAYQGAIDDDPKVGGKSTKNYVTDAVNALLNDSTVAVTTTQSYGCSIKYKQ